MARKPRFSKVKAMLPNFFVFCEGDSEVKYVEILRSYFRQPVHICKKDIAQYHSSIGGTLQTHEFPTPSTGIYKLIEMLSSDTRQSHESRK
jgi:hypothetical protein